MPRPRVASKWPLGTPGQRTDRYARSAKRTWLHVLSLDRESRQLDGERGIHYGVSPAPRACEQQECLSSSAQSFPDLSESGTAPPYVPQAIYAARLGGILRVVPQGA